MRTSREISCDITMRSKREIASVSTNDAPAAASRYIWERAGGAGRGVEGSYDG